MSVEQSFIFQSHTVERRVHTHSIKNEQKVLIQLSNTSWELHPGRRKNTMHTRCVHVCQQWYKIHIKYICRINTAQILDIQHTLEQSHTKDKWWGRERTWFIMSATDLSYWWWSREFSEEIQTQLHITHVCTHSLNSESSENKREERSFLLSWSCYQSWKYSLVSLRSDFWLGGGYRKLTSWLLSSIQAVNRELAVGLVFSSSR